MDTRGPEKSAGNCSLLPLQAGREVEKKRDIRPNVRQAYDNPRSAL